MTVPCHGDEGIQPDTAASGSLGRQAIRKIMTHKLTEFDFVRYFYHSFHLIQHTTYDNCRGIDCGYKEELPAFGQELIFA